MPAADALLGRDAEVRQLATLLGRARNGRGGSLLVTGEPGIGKTALLDAVSSDPAGLRPLRLVGYEAESTIPSAAIQRLIIPLRDRLPSLPDRHRQAIAVAAGDADGPAPDRFLVGLGMLGLLSAASAQTPVVCVVDDAHLLDAESLDALGFVARRIEAEPIAILFAGRAEEGLADRLVGVPGLTLQGLPLDFAVRLLHRSLAEPVDPTTAAQIARSIGGNPLALVDLAHELSAQQLSGLGLDDRPIPAGHRLEAHYLRRVREMDTDVQGWLLLAAADSAASMDVVGTAADLLRIDRAAGDRAESVGLVELADTVRFRHPLVRSAVYNAATGADRRRVHGALAVAAERLGLVEIEAWHAAQATLGTDPAVADRLEHAADIAARRGGFASRASVLTRAAELTPPGPRRANRLIGAAEASLAVGAVQIAAGLLARVDATDFDPVLRARIIVVRYGLALFVGDADTLPRGTALLIEAADGFHGHDADLEQRTLLKAFESCVVADRLMAGVSLATLGDRLASGAGLLTGPTSVILRGLSAMICLPYDRAVPAVRAAMAQIGRLDD
ncbi:MAG TPA: AAA family ATPase, partial [Nakamurella sp.]